MSENAARWGDLRTRILTAAAMALAGFVAIVLGGWWIIALVALCAGIMTWELVRMAVPENPNAAVALGVLATATVGGLVLLGSMAASILALAFAGFLVFWIRRDRIIFLSYGLFILLACVALIAIRIGFGLQGMVWLVLVVIATDTAGYFAGRILGGPKFWPRVSPKKTWSGTMAGWVAAALVGAILYREMGLNAGLIGMSVLVSFASQLGDIAESAIKRRVGVKDASNLLPGHGGLLDRFDGLLAASVMAFVLILGFMSVPTL